LPAWPGALQAFAQLFQGSNKRQQPVLTGDALAKAFM
jgi:hypothetical protein